MSGLEQWHVAAGEVARIIGIHIGVTPELDDIPVGCWAERKNVSRYLAQGGETWILVKASK